LQNHKNETQRGTGSERALLGEMGKYAQLSAEEEEFPPPEWRPEKVSLCSRLLFQWVTPLIVLGKNRQINQGDLPPLEAGKLHGQDLEIKPLVERFAELREKAPHEPLFVPLLKVFKANIVLAWFFAVSEQACNLSNPVLLRWFLATFNEPTELSGASSGYELGILMLLVSMLQTFLGNHGFLIISTLGVKQRAVIMTVLYRKALRLSNESRQTSSVGQIVNLMSNDANRFPEFSMFVIRIWMVPIYLLIALAQLFSLLGAPAFAGVVVLILGGWVNAQVMKRLHKLRTTQLTATDDRVMQTNEAILGIRIVKMNCWEEPIEKRIDDYRKRELSKLKTQERFIAGNRFAFFSIPIITALSTFVSYSLLGGQMTAEKVFTSMALFNIMQMYLQELPRAVATLTQVVVAQRRLSDFLSKSELDSDPTDVRKDMPSNDGFGSTLIADNASFKWDDTTSVPVLSGVNFKASGGELAAVVGSVGAGKSTLISCLLGELTKLNGRVELRGRVALCTQQPWLITATLKENILFGQPFDSTKFWDVIESCCLGPDLDQLPAAEETGIGGTLPSKLYSTLPNS
jgi:ATP-binding cassette subfamily C (CFTR/MRP) protein 1